MNHGNYMVIVTWTTKEVKTLKKCDKMYCYN